MDLLGLRIEAELRDSESPYHHTFPPHEHDTKVIVHDDYPFIIAKDNHFMIDMLNIDEEDLKEGKHGLTSPIERKSAKVTGLPDKYLNFKDSLNRNETVDENREALYSDPPSGFEMVVKDDFYTHEIITKVEVPDTIVCIEDEPCHIVKDISIYKGVQSPDRSLVENDVGQMEPSISHQTLDNGEDDSSSKMAGFAAADYLKYTVCNSPHIIVDKDQSYLASVLHNNSDGKGSSVGSFDSGVKLDMTASLVSNTSAKINEILADQASVFYNDSEGKGASVPLFNSDGKLDATESVVSNISSEVTESPEVPASNVHSECDRKVSSASLLDCGGKLDTSEYVAVNTFTVVTETSEIAASNCHNECVGKGSVSPVGPGVKLCTFESIASNIPTEFTQSQLSSSQEITTDSLHGDSLHLVFSSDQKQSIDRQKYKDVSGERKSASAALSFPSEVGISALGNGSKEIPKVPSGVITFSFETDAASTSGRDENKETTDNQQAKVAKNDPGTEEVTSDGPAVSSRRSFLPLMQGESNLSGPDFLSGPIANSGHIPYSGSISLRSDSSSTSARSFAFPTLQSEWNFSPVKMAKADRRHLRKHRGWRMGLVCCRF